MSQTSLPRAKLTSQWERIRRVHFTKAHAVIQSLLGSARVCKVHAQVAIRRGQFSGLAVHAIDSVGIVDFAWETAEDAMPWNVRLELRL
jgi:hypothetical protein